MPINVLGSIGSAFIVLTPAPVPVAPTVLNGSFDSPTTTTRTQLQTSTVLTNYTIATFNNSTQLTLVSSNNFWIIRGTNADFNQVAAPTTQYIACAVGPTLNNSTRTTVTQSITFTTNGTFFLTFQALRRNAVYPDMYNNFHQMRAIINGNVIRTTTLAVTDTTWTTYKTSFTVTAGTYPLVFESFLTQTITGQSGILLTGISITLT
jgi:hypothetical protein